MSRGNRKLALSRAKSPQSRENVHAWPIIRAYIPLQEAWQATGFGCAGIVRQKPDGSVATALFDLSLLHGGIEQMLGSSNTTLQATEELLQISKYIRPPLQESSPDLVSRYVWGAYAWGLAQGYEWPSKDIRSHLNLVPPLTGTKSWWLQQFIQDDLSPTGLVQFLLDNPIILDDEDDIPPGREIMILTSIIFHIDNPHEAHIRLAKNAPEFTLVDQSESATHFNWTRKYPKNHWSPLASLGGRQILGTVTLDQNQLIADIKTLSMGSILVEKLKDLLGPTLRLDQAFWQNPLTILDDTEDLDDPDDLDDLDNP